MGASTHTGAADVPSTPSTLTAVVVHSSGAVCTRTARLAMPRLRADGTAAVRVTGLPPALHAHSLRARVTGGAPGARVTDVRLDLAATLQRSDELPHLRLDVEDAQDRVARLADRVHRLEQEIEETASLRAEPPQPRRGDPPRWAPVESLLALAGFVETRLATLHTRLRATTDELAEATHAADVLADRMATASTATPTGRTAPTVSALLTLALPGEQATRTADGGSAPGGGEATGRGGGAWVAAGAQGGRDGDGERAPKGEAGRPGGERSVAGAQGGGDGERDRALGDRDSGDRGEIERPAADAQGGRDAAAPNAGGDAAAHAADPGAAAAASGARPDPGAPGARETSAGVSPAAEPPNHAPDGAGRSPAAAGTAPGADATHRAGGDWLELEVEYQVPGAAWAPVYQLRLDGRTGDGSLVLRACVAQRTGEDWAGVRLGLSTADLMRRTDLPELRSLRIGRRQEPPRPAGWREPPPGLGELFGGYDAGRAARAERAPHAAGSSRAAAVAGPALMAPAPAESDHLTYGVAHDAAYGGAPGPMPPGGPAPAPMAPGGPAPAPMPPGAAEPPRARMRHAARGSRPAFAAAQDAFGGAPAASAPAPAPVAAAPAALTPSADLLDYAALTMTGPDAPHGRGTLRPAEPHGDAVTAEYHRRAVSVDHLPRPAHGVDVRVSAGSFDYRFDTAAPVDVDADGAWHTVPVGEVPVRTEPGYVCVPSQDTAVFGTVLLTNTSPHALLAGPADVLVDGDFVLTAPLPTLAPGQRQAVGLGVAESVQVARTTRMRESTAGLRGGTTVLDHTVEIEVANRLPYAVTVEIRERVPVSTDKDVRIEEHQARPPWAAPDGPSPGQEGVHARGMRVWRVELAPGEATTLTGGYDIRLPAGKSVVGGNRRN